MTDMRSQPTSKSSIAPTDDEICDHVLGTRPYYVRSLGYGITAPSSSHSSTADIYSTCEARLMEVQRQAAVDRQQAEQRAQKLAAHVDEYQQLQIQMMEWMVQMEQTIQLMRQQQAGLSSVKHFPSPAHSPDVDI